MTLSAETIKSIDQIFGKAYAEGRNLLYEYEVYQILSNIGLNVPKFVLVENPDQITCELFTLFDRDIVIKIVSPQIPHKQKMGGVKIVKNFQPGSISEIIKAMQQEVLSHFTVENKPVIVGYLIVEFIPHSQAIGYEMLIGVKEDPAFGPILTLSKGGDDAEFFATYYDPANLFLPPLSYAQVITMVNQLKIRHKFKQIGHLEYLEYTAKAVDLVSQLAYDYSFIAEQRPRYIIKALDINPLVISEDNRMIAIDGFAEFTLFEEEHHVIRESKLDNLESFFHPEGIVVVGVSADLNKFNLAREIAQLLHDMGRKDIYFINPKGGSTYIGDTEYPLYKNFEEIMTKIDLVVYAAPAQHTIEFLQGLGSRRPKALILISGIPAQLKYEEFTTQLDSVKPEGLRILGPNCMGVFFAPDKQHQGLNTLFVNEKRLELKYSETSNTVLLSQSGALALTSIDKLKYNCIFKAVVSFGNEYDVKITELMAYLAGGPDIDLISVYLEGLAFGEGRQLFQLAREINKPMIIYKSGRTEAGAKAAASHTAAISGDYDVFKAACLQAGMILAETLEDHYNYLRVFSLLAKKIPTGNRVAGVVNAGFESAVGADELRNMQQAKLSETTIEKLKEINKYGLVETATPFLDLTPMADDQIYANNVEVLLQDENVDCVFVAVVPHSSLLKTTPDTCRDPDSLANLLLELSKKYQKPMVISNNAGRYYQEFVAVMEEGGLPVFLDIRAAIKSLDAFVTYHLIKQRKASQYEIGAPLPQSKI